MSVTDPAERPPIPVVDLARRGALLAPAFGEAAARIAASGQYLLGAELAGFEAELAEATGAAQAVAVASGAAAIQLALTAAGLGPGDEVIVPAFTAVPTVSAVLAAGCRPVLADVDPTTACVTGATIAAARTDRTRGVVVVHLYGAVADALGGAVDGLVVIDDAAQSSGAMPPPSHSRHRSRAVAYSFYPTKNLGGIGDGGAVVTDDGDLADRVRRLRVHGMTTQYVHTEISQNFRMSELDAAWLRLGLPALAADVARRGEIAARYRAAAPHLRWHAGGAGGSGVHAMHLCVLRHQHRDELRARLAAAGVASAVHYPLAIHHQPAYAAMFAATTADAANAWAAECLSVPCFAEMTDDEIDIVAAALAEVPREAP